MLSQFEKDTLKKRLEQARSLVHQHGGFPEFDKWRRPRKYRGFSNPSISVLLDRIEAGSDSDLEEKVTRFETIVQEFITTRHDSKNVVQDSVRQKLCNTQWYLYFFYPIPRHEQDAAFGRAVLKIDSNGLVTVRNIEDGISPNYQGSFRIIKNEMLVIDAENEVRGKHLHMKAYINPDYLPSEVLLGGFLSNGRDYLFAGTVLLEKQDPAAHLQAAIFNYHTEPDIFHHTHTHIRNLLKVRSLNYLRIPPAVFLKSNLGDVRKGESPHPNTRFVEPDKPVIFVSAPTYSVQDDTYKNVNLKLEKIIRDIEARYQDKIEVRFFAFRDLQRQTRLEYNKVLNDIRGASLFLLVFLEKASSNALIELGMAYAYAKHIKILARKDALPNNGFLRHGSNHIELKEYDIETNDDIFKNINTEIVRFLDSIHVKED